MLVINRLLLDNSYDMIARGNLGHSLSVEINQAHQNGASEQAILNDFRLPLIRLARISRSRAANHRGLLTGGGVVFRVTNVARDLDFYEVEALHNWSPFRGSPKSCSEMGAGEAADMLQQDYGIGPVRGSALVVAANGDPRSIASVMGVEMSTLIPCHDCGDVLAANPTAFPENMPVITVGLGANREQQTVVDYTVGEVLGILATLPRPLSSGELMAGIGAAAI